MGKWKLHKECKTKMEAGFWILMNYWKNTIRSEMKKLVIYIFLITLFHGSWANTIIISSDNEHITFDEAYQKAAPYDTIKIAGRTLDLDNFIIEKPLHIIGTNGATIKSKFGGEIFTVASDHVSIKGITFKNVKTNFLKENAAIRIRRKSHFTISDNTFIDCFFSIYLERGKNGKISNNYIRGDAKREADSGNGIHAWYCENLTITGNEISGHRDGIYFEFVNNSSITENYSYTLCSPMMMSIHTIPLKRMEQVLQLCFPAESKC